MSPIRIISWIHLAWGLSMLAFWALGVAMPRPFGSLEAYLAYLSAPALGACLFATSLLSFTALHMGREWPWAMALGVVPQQLVLLWGVLWSVLALVEGWAEGPGFDPRTWLGCSYLTVLSVYHGLAIARVYGVAWGGRRAGVE